MFSDTELKTLKDCLKKSRYSVGSRTVEALIERLELVQVECDKYRECLVSISKNSCCDKCQEAALWAKQALQEEKRK